MSRTESQRGPRVSTAELQPVLEELLRTQGPTSSDGGYYRRITRLERTSSPYSSSFPLEEIVVSFEDGQRLDLIFKNCSPHALSPEARRAKPEFLDDPRREIEVYLNLIHSGRFGTAHLYGSVVDEASDRYWLFLEKVIGRELYQVGEFDIWKQVARWLANTHTELGQGELPPKAVPRLVRYDADYYELWLARGIAFSGTQRQPGNMAADFLRGLARHYSEVVRALSALPRSPIHGEFYASNVLVHGPVGELRVCPVDWERVALGPGLVDLAALTAGKWSEEQRAELALEYFAASEFSVAGLTSPEEFLRGVQLCRLHLAVQWLGWSPDWSPPLDHRHDWLIEATIAAKALGLMI